VFSGVLRKTPNSCLFFPTALACSFDQKLKDKIQFIVLARKSFLAWIPLRRKAVL